MSDMHPFSASAATIWMGVTNVGNEAKPLKYSEQSCICYQFRAHAPMYDHRPQYIANNNKAEIVMCAQNCRTSA
jgi:hypothetical protein